MNNPKETKETFDQLLYAGPITVKCESCATVLSFVEGSANSIFAHYDQHNGYCPHDVNVGDVDEDWQDWEADQNQQAQDPGENNPQQFKMLSTAQMSDPTKVPGIGTATAKHIIAALQAQPPPTNWREFSRITTTHGHRHFAKAPQRGLRARAPRLTAGARHAHSKPGHAANEWQLSIERQAYARRRRAKKLHLKGMSTEPRPQSLREDHGYHGERRILSKATKDSRRYPAATGGGDRRNDSK